MSSTKKAAQAGRAVPACTAKAIKLCGLCPLLFFGFLCQIVGTFTRMAHQYGARTRNLSQSLDIGFYLESCGLKP